MILYFGHRQWGSPLHGATGNIGYNDSQSPRNPLVSAQPLLQNAIGLSPERFRVTLNRVGGIHMGNPGLVSVERGGES